MKKSKSLIVCLFVGPIRTQDLTQKLLGEFGSTTGIFLWVQVYRENFPGKGGLPKNVKYNES